MQSPVREFFSGAAYLGYLRDGVALLGFCLEHLLAFLLVFPPRDLRLELQDQRVGIELLGGCFAHDSTIQRCAVLCKDSIYSAEL